MIRLLLFALFFTSMSLPVFSQDEDHTPEKKSNHYLGIQVNPLIRQIFNFSSANTPIDNPFLITYAVNSIETGWGLNVGLGYRFDEIKENNNSNERETKINDLSFRVGFEKKTYLSKRWIMSLGIDALHEKLRNHTISRNTNGFGATPFKIETDSKSTGWGIGPRFTINYQVSERILLGTEANYYFKTIKETTEFKSDSSSQNTPEDPVKFKKFQLHLPISIQLIVKL